MLLNKIVSVPRERLPGELCISFPARSSFSSYNTIMVRRSVISYYRTFHDSFEISVNTLNGVNDVSSVYEYVYEKKMILYLKNKNIENISIDLVRINY